MEVLSFSYRYGNPGPRLGEDFVIDARVLTNPYVHGKTGLDEEVKRKVFSNPRADDMVAQAVLWAFEHPEGRILVGCSYGRHRSVAIAEKIASKLGVKARHTSRRMRG